MISDAAQMRHDRSRAAVALTPGQISPIGRALLSGVIAATRSRRFGLLFSDRC